MPNRGSALLFGFLTAACFGCEEAIFGPSPSKAKSMRPTVSSKLAESL